MKFEDAWKRRRGGTGGGLDKGLAEMWYAVGLRHGVETTEPPMSSGLREVPGYVSENKKLRELLWLMHGHDGLYGDDGEMQCGTCKIDFKRDSAERIATVFSERRQKVLEESGLIELLTNENFLFGEDI